MRRSVVKVSSLLCSVLLLQAAFASSSYEWKLARLAGSGCFPPKCVQGKFPRAVLPIMGARGSLLSIGSDTVWSSTNGVDWTSRPKTDWGERHGMNIVLFRDRYFMTGGMRSWDDFRNDVYVSANTIGWKQVVTSAPWKPRRGHNVVVFNEKLVLIGGAVSSGRKDQTPTSFYNDIWTSDDGRDWETAVENAGWPGRGNYSAVVHNGMLWMLDGDSGDIWVSENIRDWKILRSDAPWRGRSGHAVHVFDGRIWVLGGIDRNDVWSSTDGKEWKLEFAAAPWSKRSTVYSAVFNDRIWLFSGKTGREDSWAGDIWALGRKGE